MSDDLKSITNQKNNSKSFDAGGLFLWLFLFFAISSPVIGWLLVKGDNKTDFTDLGTYGDFLGGSTIPFLTVITILFIYRTYNLQQEQLKTQQRELSLLQKEMESTKETLQEQSKTAKMQRFENSFFIQIDELKKAKIEAMTYLEINFGETYTFNEWMKYIRGNIDKYMIDSLIDPSKRLPEEKEIYKYFDEYGNLLSEALDESGIYGNEVIPSFFSSVNRILRLIYEYKNSMDNWEVDFYLDYLKQKIGKESINIILYGICNNKKMIPIAKELTFNKFADVTYKYARKEDFRYINYVLHNDPDYDLCIDKDK